MALYHYRAIDSQGHLLQGYISGHNSREARQHLLDIHIEPFSVRRRWLITYNPKELGLFFRYLAYALEAGHALAPALAMIQEAFQGFLKEVISSVHQKLIQGRLLSEACQDYPMIFSPPLVALIQLGEQSGSLAHICHQASAYISQVQAQRKTFWKTLAHPLANFSFLFIAFFILIASLLPEVMNLLTEHHIPLPMATKILNVCAQASWGFLLFISLLGLGGLLTFKWGQFRIPWIARYRLQPYYLRFFSSLSLLVREKMPLIAAIAIACKGIRNPYLTARLHLLMHDIQKGKKFYEALSTLPHLPSFYHNLMQVGETTGQQAHALVAATQLMTEDMTHRMDKLMTWLPSCLMVLIGLCFWLLIEGTFIPIYEHIGTSRYGL